MLEAAEKLQWSPSHMTLAVFDGDDICDLGHCCVHLWDDFHLGLCLCMTMTPLQIYSINLLSPSSTFVLGVSHQLLSVQCLLSCKEFCLRRCLSFFCASWKSFCPRFELWSCICLIVFVFLQVCHFTFQLVGSELGSIYWSSEDWVSSMMPPWVWWCSKSFDWDFFLHYFLSLL